MNGQESDDEQSVQECRPNIIRNQSAEELKDEEDQNVTRSNV